jgi:uncharacterized protein
MKRRSLFIAAMALASTALAQESGMETELHAAAAANETSRIEALLVKGAAIDVRDGSQRTPLLTATRANAVEAARLLISRGADVNAKDNIADTPFLYAGAEGRLEILKLILATGKAKLKDTNRFGGNALIPAAHHGHPETVRELLKTKIDVNHVNRLGWTALLETIILSDGGPTHQDIMQQLIAAGADVNLADGEGTSPMAHAKQRGYREMVKMLEKAGAK